MTTEVFIAIDMARDSLEIGVRSTGEQWQVGNDAAGIPAPLLHQDVEDDTFLVDGPPQPVARNRGSRGAPAPGSGARQPTLTPSTRGAHRSDPKPTA
jgi:hypothetical protein